MINQSANYTNKYINKQTNKNKERNKQKNDKKLKTNQIRFKIQNKCVFFPL